MGGETVPDVRILKRPRSQLEELVQTCTDELAAFSRWTGANPADPDDLKGLALLPPALLCGHPSPRLATLVTRIDAALSERETGSLPAEHLFDAWPPAKSRQLSKREAVGLVQLLAGLGYGMEPDIRFVGPKLALDHQVVLFRLPADAPEVASPEYQEAANLLHLASMVSTADGTVSAEEEAHLLARVEGQLGLAEEERRRLAAYLGFLHLNPVNMSGLKKRVEGLDQASRETVGRFLVDVAVADGVVDPAEVRVLTRLYRTLGLDENGLYGHIHAAGTGTAPSTREVEKAAPGARVVIDPEALRRRMESTERVGAILHAVFACDEDDEETRAPAPAPQGNAEPAIAGLDAPHSAFFRALGEQDEWPSDAIDALATRFGLMPAGTVSSSC